MSPVTRRTVLQAGALTLFANALTANMTLSTAGAVPPLVPVRPNPVVGGVTPVGATNSGQFTPPYTVTESSVLSEDYFRTDQVILGSGDVVKAFLSPDGYVEALVAQDGNLFHLKKDPTTTSGWNYQELTGQDGGLLTGVTDIAVGIDSDGYSWAVVITDGGTDFVMMTQDNTGAWQFGLPRFGTLPFGSLGGTIGPLKSAYDSSGNIYFTAFFTARPGVFLVWDPNSIDNNMFNDVWHEVDSLAGKDLGSSPFVLWSALVPTDGAGVLARNSAGAMVWYPQLDSQGTYGQVQTFDGVDTSTLLWADCGTVSQPGPRYLTTFGTILAKYSQATIQQTGLAGVDGLQQVAVWENNDIFTVAGVDNSSTLRVLTMLGADDATPFIPIAADIQTVTSYLSDPNDATLFVTDVAGVLSVMTKSAIVDPASGDPVAAWASIPVQQTSTTAQEIDCYRTQLTVVDANGVPVANTSIQLTPDRAVGLWQPGGHLVLDPTHPATLTTDNYGRLTFAVPATEVDSPLFSAQFFDNGAPSGDPVPVNPAGEVHAFLAGSAALNNLGTVGGPALLAATNTAQTPLFPVLTNLSGADQATASAGVASAIGQCMSAGQAGTPGPNDPQSFKLDMSGAVPTYESSTDPNNFPTLVGGSWWDDAKQDAESVYHGIRHGLIKVSQCVAAYAKDAEQWTVNLAITIGDDVSDVVSYAITDIRSAIHAVSGFFQTLGADIKDAVHWLRMFLGDLFKDTETNAQTVLGWLHAYPTQLVDGLTTAGGLAAGAFTALKATINDELSGTVLPATSGTTMSGGATGLGGPLGTTDLTAIITDVRHNWLFEKAFAELDQLALGGGSDDALGGLLTTAVEAMLPTKLIGEIAAALWAVMADTVKAAADMKGFSVTTLMSVIQNLLDDFLAYLDGIVASTIALLQGVLDQVGAFLDTNMEDQVPLLGAILEHFGLDSSLTAGHLFTLIAMFPTTLIYMATTGSDSGVMYQQVGLGTDPDDPYGVGAGKDLLARDLKITHGVVRAVNGIVDVIVDASVFADSEAPAGRVAPLKIFGLVDAITTMILQVVVYPGKPNGDGSTAIPCTTPPNYDLNTSLGWMVMFKMIFGATNPLIGIVLQSAKIATGDKYTVWLPILRSVLAATNLGLSIAIEAKGDAHIEVYAATAVEMSNLIISPFVGGIINDENFAVPLAVKALGDVCQTVAGALYIDIALS